MGLLPWVFRKFTPEEFNLYIKGYNTCKARERDMAATMTVTLCNATGRLKKKMRVEDILGRPLTDSPSDRGRTRR